MVKAASDDLSPSLVRNLLYCIFKTLVPPHLSNASVSINSLNINAQEAEKRFGHEGGAWERIRDGGQECWEEGGGRADPRKDLSSSLTMWMLVGQSFKVGSSL